MKNLILLTTFTILSIFSWAQQSSQLQSEQLPYSSKHFTKSQLYFCKMNQTNLTPPMVEKKPTVLNYHGQKFIDNYYWLREKENPNVINYLNDENNYTNLVLKDTETLQKDLFEEIKARIKEDDESVPVFEDGYYYYERTREGDQYPIHCRKKGNLEAKEEILLDENKLAEGETYFSLADFTISPNNNLLAYSIDTEGNEEYTIFVLDLTTQKLNKHSVIGAYYGLEWANDNESIYYTKFDEAHRPYQLWKHNIHQDVTNDTLLFEETNQSYFLQIDKTKDNEYLLLSLNSQITTEIYVKSARDNEPFVCIAKKKEGVQYDVDHKNGLFYILTNENAINFKLMKTKASELSKEYWVEVLPHDLNRYRTGLEIFNDYIVLEERVNGQQNITIYKNNFSTHHSIQFDDPAYSVSVGDNPEMNSETLRIHYRSLVTPNTTYDYNMRTHEKEVLKVQEVPSGYNIQEYTSERIFATAEDGQKIPISLVYKKSLKQKQGNPLYLYGYGSYGVNLDPYFSVARLSLLDRGFIFAIANVRGGSEKGRQWYNDGKFLNKKNTFTDFIACANHLVSNQYTTNNQLAANGGSAGGLLMGAITNLAPDTFHTVVADVPFVDVINTMMDETIPLTVIEYDEWGNPNEKDYFDYMLSYSPYDNIERKNYPNILVTAGLNDPRVQYWEPAKYVAKLRDYKTNDKLLLLKTNMDAGHGGASGRFDRLKEIALEYAFILKTLHLNQN